MLNKRSNWIFYIMQLLCLLIFSFINHLYGDVLNNVIYLVIGIIGFILWDKNKYSSKISYCTKKERFIYVIIIVVSTIILKFVLSNTNDPLPLLDSFTSVSSFVATYYMLRRKIDAWIIWFFNDVMYAVEYFILPNQAIYLFLLNIIWTFLAIASYYNWKKIMVVDNYD